MEPRKKPIPHPIPRASTVRPLVAATVRRGLPTVAALLAATSMLACGTESPTIEADKQVMSATMTIPKPVASEPGMGGLEVEATPPDPVVPNPRPVVKPVPVPRPPAGGIKPAHPTPMMAGKMPAVHTTI